MGLRNLLDKQEKHFKKGGRLERLYPLFEATDTFLYTPGKVTQLLESGGRYGNVFGDEGRT